MATPMSADQLVAALRAEGVRYVEHRSWRTHNRNHKGAWGPVHGVYIHHTAGVSKTMADICYDGYAELPGPVCHGMLAKSARLYLVGNGRANHAGGIAQNAYDAAVNEDAVHPRPDAAEPIDGNVHFYGLEIENEGDGEDPFPADQYDQAVRWAAAHCRFHGWSADSVIGHKEATRRKVDPAFSMPQFRADVAERLAHAPSWSPGTTQPPTSEEDNMPSAAEIFAHQIDIPDGRKVAVADILAWTDNRHNVVFKELGTVKAELGAVKAQLAELTAAVKALTTKEA
ncbi:N-acetylmuramoyl-L-alanine amidase [Streptomyces sp. NPDC060020]|uniref:peptidoglycan recognition protein family protein n=1 Tax=Streptomyces sp. NPDC060020 TaxID=3347038 RepID=UPI0036ACDA9D